MTVNRKYDPSLLTMMQENQALCVEDGLPVLVKPIPDDPRSGAVDPRVYAKAAPMFSGFKGSIVRAVLRLGALRKPSLLQSAKHIRKAMDGIDSIPITEGVTVTSVSVPGDAADIPIRLYASNTPTDNPRPVFYFIHGGGFVAGHMGVVDELCKWMAAQTGCLAVQLEYRLAPEHPFPAGLNDCYTVLKWIYGNIQDFGGDPQMLCISGDSAGGNLATVCAIKDRDEGTGMVKLQALLYPVVDLRDTQKNAEQSRSLFDVIPEHAQAVHGMLDAMQLLFSGFTLGEYLGLHNTAQPYASPILDDLHGMPPTLLLFGEYDFLRAECEQYAHKLIAAQNEVCTIRYQGLFHAFAQRVGVLPQAEDALREIGRFLHTHQYSA